LEKNSTYNGERIIKPLLIASNDKDLLGQGLLNQKHTSVVEEIEKLSIKYQAHAESNIATIRLIQSIALFGPPYY